MSGGTATEYVIGPTHGNVQSHATFETKPSVADYTGGGYERWRSTEYRPHTARRAREDVYASHHRLLAIVECYSLDTPIEDVLDDLYGRDVHHTTGVPWCNFGTSPNFEQPGIEVVDHARHSEITQTQRRAWAADAKREVEQLEQQSLHEDRCAGCDTVTDVLATSKGFDGERCLECAKQAAGDHAIKL